MAWVEHGKVEAGRLIFAEPLVLPDGTRVTALIEVEEEMREAPASERNFETLPFFGMWADRDDLADSAAWVRQERQRWQRRKPPL